MNRSLYRIAAHVQLGIAFLLATGCAPTQPFFYNESPDLQHYLSTATRIEYPDVDVESLPETVQAEAPLALGNHNYEFWDLTVEECVAIALQNAKFFVTTSGNAEFRQNVAAQFVSASADQLGSVYDVAIQQTTTQSLPLTVDGNGNRTLPRGILRANQIGGVEDALAEFDAQASAFVSYNTTDRPRNVAGDTAVSTQLFQATDVTQQAALSKRFATGGVGTLRQQIIYSRNNLPVEGEIINGAPVTGAARAVRSDWTAVLEAQVQHPLMRNRGTLVNRIPVVLASLNEDVAIADFEIQVRNLVRDVEVAYWDLYVAYRNVSTAAIGRNSAIATARAARLTQLGGAGTKQQVAQAEEQYYNFRARLYASLAGSNVAGDDREGVYGTERNLRELMGLAPTDGRLIRPIEEPTLARVEFDWEECVTQMLHLSAELRRGRSVIKQRELEQISAKNQLLPEVNLSLLYRWVGVGDTLGPPERRSNNFPGPGTSALGELTEGNYQEGAIRLEITPPAVGGRRERTRIRGSQLRLKQSRAYIEEAERLLVSQLSDAIAKTVTHYRLVQTNAMRWQATEREVEARLAQFRAGDTDINVVLQSQQRRADAQISYYRALAEYNKSINYVNYLKGTMLHDNNITLAEGPWNKKAYWDALERARERSAGKAWKYGVTRPGVVRRGPVTDPLSQDAAEQAGIDPNVFPNAQIIEGEGALNGEIILEEPLSDVPEVGDSPLRELGDSPAEMIAPGEASQIESPPSPSAGSTGSGVVPEQTPANNGDADGNSQVLPAPVPEAAPDRSGGVRRMPPPTRLKPSTNRVLPMSYEAEIPATETRSPDAAEGSAPKPVRRKPVPTAS